MFLLLYPQYDHTYLFQKTYFEGGLTIDQFELLLRVAVKRENNKFRMQAALQGVKLPDDEESTKQNTTNGDAFGSPEMYEQMTEEEREAANTKLMKLMQRIGMPITNTE